MHTEGHEMNIRIDTGSVVKVLVVLLLAFSLYLLRDLLMVVLTAIVIASAAEPATKWFARYRVPRLLAVILMYLLTGLGLFVIFYLLLPSLLSDVVVFMNRLPDYVGQLDVSQLLQHNNTLVRSQEALQGLSETLSAGDFLSAFRSYLVNIPGGVFSTVSTVFGGVLSLVLIVIVSFYLSVQEGGIEHFLRVVTPFRHQRYAVGLWRRTQEKIGKWMQGQLLLMLIMALLVYLGLTIIGVKHALLLAVLAALFELIPVFGPVLSSIPAIASGFSDGGLTTALIVGGLYVVIQQFENHLIYPLVVNKVVGVPPLLVILALIAGGTLFGFLGVLLAVPIAAALMEFTTDIQRRNKMLEEMEEMKESE